MISDSIDRDQDRPALWDFLRASIGGWLLFAIGLAYLTVELNSRLRGSLSDVALLTVYSVVFFVAIGVGLGLVAAMALNVLARLAPPLQTRAKPIFSSLLFFPPLLYFLLLPDLGLAREQLANLIFGSSTLDKVLAGIVLAGFSVLLGFLSRMCSAALERSLGLDKGRVAGIAWVLALVGSLALTLFSPGRSEVLTPTRSAVQHEADLTEPPIPVVLLCIDGVDPRVLERKIALGELPTFARLIRDGTSGPLETLEPTLSAVVWTTIATGKPKREHEIHHFVHTRLPGMQGSILEFPLHSGLNFSTLPWLERIGVLPDLQVPYTSTMRRSQALWEIVGRFYPVGVWKWLISWPAEVVNGFYVSGGVGWAQFEDEQTLRGIKERSTHPRGLFRGLERLGRLDLATSMQAFAGGDLQVSVEGDRWKPMRGMLGNRVNHYLPLLMSQFQPRFVAAAYYNLDVFHHFYGQSGPEEEALIDKSYRYVDERLGELLGGFDEEVQLLVISDHGFDFEHGHHTFAPPGIFIGHGPAFLAGARVEGLSVFDMAPMVLRLLGLPLAEDMKGSRGGFYERALSEAFLADHPASFVDSWEAGDPEEDDEDAHPIEEEMRDVLESLGYLG